MRLLPLVLSLGLLLALGVPTASAQNLRFGTAMVAGDGDVIVGEVANSLRPGTVYLYRQGDEGWEERAQLRGPEPEVRDGFGGPLALTGSTLLVGQRRQIRIFERDASGTYRLAGTISEPETEEGEEFGAALAAEDDWVLVGAPAHGQDGGRTEESLSSGAVYAFQRDAQGEWVRRAKLTAADPSGAAGFGTSIAIDDRRAIVGAPGTNDEAGAAYLFQLDEAAGAWTETARFAADNPQPGDGFGSSVDLGSELAVVGVPLYAGGHGAAYVFRLERERDAWVQHARLLPFVGSPQDRFGTQVAIDDAEIWVGAPSTSLNPGTAYLFRAEGENLSFRYSQHWGLENPDRADRFGNRIAAGGGTALVAATGKDHGAGSVAIYRRSASGNWAEEAVLESEDQALPRVVGEEVECEDGLAGIFECTGPISLLAYLPAGDLTLPGEGRGTRINDLWGWLDPETGREYAIVGRIDGTSFVDVTDPVNPVLIGVLPQTPGGPPSPTWRDPKVYDDHAFIVADAAGAHGMQIFDLTQLRDVETPPVRFENTAHYSHINSAHNLVVNEETGFAYAVGGSSGGETCGGGLHMIDIREPTNPRFVGCFAHEGTGRTGGGATHDAQCVIYRGPDERYQGREICLSANERQLSVADVTDKANPVALSVGTYPNPGYLHQGWLTDDHRYFFMNDEGDLLAGSVETTRTLIFDVSDLEDPILHKEFMGSFPASAHNLYIVGDLMYQANYRYGLQVIDISDPSHPVEMGHLDTAPYLTGPGFGAAWGNYPFFRSGAVAVTSHQEGFFLVRYRDPAVVFED